MYKSNVKINYHGFHPSEQARLFVESIIHEIQHELPQGARVKATFSRKDEVIKGVLQVGSYAGPFLSVAASSSRFAAGSISGKIKSTGGLPASSRA
jgi:hypothetical protein